MYNEFISFLKKHNIYDEEIINHYIINSFIIQKEDDYKYSECIYVVDENDILTSIRAIIPKIVDYRTMLINIHEYVHYYILHNRLGKKITLGINCEVLPMFYERVFVIEKADEELDNYWNSLIDRVRNNNERSYIHSLEIQDTLIYLYDKCGKIKKTRKMN